MSILSERLKELRGPTPQSQFSAELGMKQQQYARYEKGTTVPGADILATICRVHAVSADWLLGLSDGRNVATTPPQSLAPKLERLKDAAAEVYSKSDDLNKAVKKLKAML